MKLTLIDDTQIDVNLNHIEFISGAAQGSFTTIQGKRVYLNAASAKIVRNDILRRNAEFERAQEQKEIIWAS